jgi:dihydropteroate synthase
MALSNKDFVGEKLAASIAAPHGAAVFRAHQVRRTRRVIDTVELLRIGLDPRSVTDP